MKIVFLYAGGRTERVKAIQQKQAPTEFFYGAIELTQMGHIVDFLEIQKAPTFFSKAWATVYNILLKWVTPTHTNGDDLIGTWQALPRLRDADCIVATTTSLAVALAIWKKMKWICTPVVGIHCGILNHPPRGIRRWITRKLLKGIPMALFAQPEAEATRHFFGFSKVFEVPFGVDTDFWSPADFEGNYILSVGSDSRRDYTTLLAAAERISLPIKILTSHTLPSVLPPNVSLLQGSWKNPALNDAELLHLYRKARFVVVPLIESIQPAGQSVALQAMACGKPVILTRTSGLWTENNFNENEEILLVPEKDPEALAHTMLTLWNNPDKNSEMGNLAREAVLRTGNIRSFANGILECCRQAMAN